MRSTKSVLFLSAIGFVLELGIAVARAQEPGQEGAKSDTKPTVYYSVKGVDGKFSDYNDMIVAADKAGLRRLDISKITIKK